MAQNLFDVSQVIDVFQRRGILAVSANIELAKSIFAGEIAGSDPEVRKVFAPAVVESIKECYSDFD